MNKENRIFVNLSEITGNLYKYIVYQYENDVAVSAIYAKDITEAKEIQKFA
jgi:hypothetical protein